jgi:hypothetical protein
VFYEQRRDLLNLLLTITLGLDSSDVFLKKNKFEPTKRLDFVQQEAHRDADVMWI